MIVELRQYTFAPGNRAYFLDRYRAEGMALQGRLLGDELTLYTTEDGGDEFLVILRAYASEEERLTRRQNMADDPEWQRYSSTTSPLVLGQSVRVLTPA